MKKSLTLCVYSHQKIRKLDDSFLAWMEELGGRAVPLVLAEAFPDASLCKLDEVEVSLIDDETIAEVHLRFMDIPDATDVITFDHGEIHISVETAQKQAEQYGYEFEKELVLYMIHGLLHLAGYADASEDEFLKMSELQERILLQIWSPYQ